MDGTVQAKTIKSTNVITVDSAVTMEDRWRAGNHRSGKDFPLFTVRTVFCPVRGYPRKETM